ncbi:hypothetical protein LCGC14_1953060 [marine sediment metagenome]|uniref:Uncharacterized protein n=1 Tax=marine sediment metagenome TaxID=412755 RepID=A0A0F9FGS5_9ZZZZ
MIIGKNIETKGNIDIDLQKLISTRLLIQANSGGGKSWLIRRLLEQTHGKIQQIVIDLEGEFSTLREKYDYLLVGKDGEIPANIQTAELLAIKLLKLNVSTIIDLSELKHHERIFFVQRFLESLVNAPRELWHTCLVIVDEAHQFCPEGKKSESAISVIDLQTRGRKRGFCGVLATQRISKLHKDAAAECNNVLVGRTVQDIDRKRAANDLGFTTKEQELSLRRLGDGEFFAYGPAISKEDIIKVKIGDVKTTHPEPGKNILKASQTPDNIKRLLKDVIDLPKEVETELKTKKEFQNKINELKREVRTLKTSQPKPIADERALERARQHGFKEAERDSIRQIYSLERNYKQIEKKLIDIGKILGQKIPKFNELPKFSPKPIQYEPQIQFRRNAKIITKTTVTDGNSIATDNEDKKLSPAYLRMLRACASFYPNTITKAKISFLSHIAQKASTFRNGLSKLRVIGAIEDSGTQIICTEIGLSITGPVEEVPSDPESLFRMWSQKLSPAYERILKSIYDRYPNSISKEEISEETEVPIDASTFRNGLSKLRSLGLIKNEGTELKMAEDFFE